MRIRPKAQGPIWVLVLLAAQVVCGDREVSSVDEYIDENVSETRSIGMGGADSRGHEWLIAPIPSLNPSLGWTLTVPVAMLYQPGSGDPDAQAWVSGAGGFYAENGSWGAAVYHRMNLFDDRWRLQVAAAYADLIYDFYGIGGGAGNPDRYIKINQDFQGGLIGAMREISPNLYFGFNLMALTTEIQSIEFPVSIVPEDWPAWQGLQLDLRTLTPKLLYDTRDNEFYPGSGNYANLKVDFSAEAFGSEYNYQIYKFDWNHYRTMGDNQVLAMRLAVKYGSGKVPFFLLPAMGQGSDLRGYAPGLYRDRVLVTGQAEYRLRLTDRFGLVVFGGLGSVAPAWDEFNQILPSLGTGLRWVLAEKNQISMRLDVAWGKKEREIYVGIGEAF